MVIIRPSNQGLRDPLPKGPKKADINGGPLTDLVNGMILQVACPSQTKIVLAA